jgi:hypothetical protein
LAFFSKLFSVALWKHFASTYSQEHPWPGDHKEYLSYQTPMIPPSLLPELTAQLTSPRGLLLTSLTLRNVELTRARWVNLSQLDNLANFQVNGSVGFSDQVIRAWADRAIQNQAFAHLQVLVVADEDEITLESLRFLSQLVSLKICQLSGHAFSSKRHLVDAEKYGWKRLCEHQNLET